MRTIVYAGHLSRFGLAFIEYILDSTFFNIEHIVLADAERWWQFKFKLSGGVDLEDKQNLYQDCRKISKQLFKRIKKKYPDIKLSFVNDANSDTSVDLAKNFDILLSAAFPQIFSDSFIQTMKGKMVNFHPSYLPRCRGAHPIYWTIASGEEYGGVSSHFITGQIDKGPIISRIKIPFDKSTITYDLLYSNAIDILRVNILETEDFFKKQKEPSKQNDAEASYFRNDRPIHHKIYWVTEFSEQIINKIRAGGAFCFRVNGEILLLSNPAVLVKKSDVITNDFDQRIFCGTVLKADKSKIVVKATDGIIEASFLRHKTFGLYIFYALKSVNNRISRLLINRFLNGYVIKSGEILL